jgi:nitroreductase
LRRHGGSLLDNLGAISWWWDPERKERRLPFGIDRPNRTSESMKQAPVVIAVCAEIGKSGVSYREPRQPVTDKGEYWYMFDAALAMQNLALRAHSLGLGTVIVGAFDAQKAAEVLGVPAVAVWC